MRSEIEKEKQLVEHLSNPNDWTFIEIVSVMGLDYIRYEHKSLPLIAEQEEGDDLFFVFRKDIIFENHIFTKEKIESVSVHVENLIEKDFFIFIKINEIGFKYHETKQSEQTTEIYTD